MANNAKTQNTQNTQSAPKNVKVLPAQSFKVEASRTVPDGEHTGTIQKAQLVERGEEGFRYLDLYVVESESEIVIKAGYAASRITPETELGRLCTRFGADVSEDADVNPVALLKAGTEVTFTTDTEKTKNGRFARVILESVCPAE